MEEQYDQPHVHMETNNPKKNKEKYPQSKVT